MLAKFKTINIKHLTFLIIAIVFGSFNVSCQKQTNSNQTISRCPKESTAKLENIEKIELTSITKNIEGMVANNRPKGYTFIGKKGQIIKYQIKPNNTCIWLYNPKNNMMDSPILPQDGAYVFQIASSEGSGTFQLELSINSVETPKPITRQPTASPTVATQLNPTAEADRPSPEEAVKNHYQLINDKNLDDSWNDLSTSFKGSNLARGEKEYKEWWEQVDNINISSTKIIRQNRNKAIVKTSLFYTLKSGKVLNDKKNKIYLIWDESNKKWIIDDKR